MREAAGDYISRVARNGDRYGPMLFAMRLSRDHQLRRYFARRLTVFLRQRVQCHRLALSVGIDGVAYRLSMASERVAASMSPRPRSVDRLSQRR